jgi:hypothetical protein
MFILTFLSNWVLLWLIFYPLNMVRFLPLIFSPGIFSIWVLFRLFFILSSASLAFFYLSFWLWLNLRQGFWLPQVRSSSHDLIIGYWIDIVWVKYFFEILKKVRLHVRSSVWEKENIPLIFQFLLDEFSGWPLCWISESSLQ